jgi:predicted metalloprotease with PDZ domain
LALVTGCERPPSRAWVGGVAVEPRAGSAAWRYDVVLEQARELAVEAIFAPSKDDSFRVDAEAARFVGGVSFASANGWASAAKHGEGWAIPCRAGCRVRYRFALREAADTLRDVETAIAAGAAVIAPPSSWLLHPASPGPEARLELQVQPGAGARFLTALRPVPGGRQNTYWAQTERIESLGFCGFGALETAELTLGGARVSVGIAPAGLGLTRGQALAWIEASLSAVANYYGGRLPAQSALVLLMKGSGHATLGETLSGGGPSVVVRAGDEITPATTRDDWVVTHELLHVNFPDVGRQHSWLSEGLASYVEPVARARVGLLSEAKMWHDLLEGLSQGQPEAGDRGLENTPTWGRTYWGGALFCLLADLGIRERTENARSLDDALRAIGATPASVEDRWSVERVIAVGDRATGVPVLRELYERYALRAEKVDLAALFTRLGVRESEGSVVFENGAPLAKIRAAISAPSVAARTIDAN